MKITILFEDQPHNALSFNLGYNNIIAIADNVDGGIDIVHSDSDGDALEKIHVPQCENGENDPTPQTVQLPTSAPAGGIGEPRSSLAWPGTRYTTAEHCQYCGNSWTCTRTLGTPRLDSVRCPNCKRLV